MNDGALSDAANTDWSFMLNSNDFWNDSGFDVGAEGSIPGLMTSKVASLLNT